MDAERRERAEYILLNSVEYVRGLSSLQVKRLLESLAAGPGLSPDERKEVFDGRWNVGYEFVPDRLKE